MGTSKSVIGKKECKIVKDKKRSEGVEKRLELLLKIIQNRKGKGGKKIIAVKEKSSMDYEGLEVKKKKNKKDKKMCSIQ